MTSKRHEISGLNGQELKLQANGEQPKLEGRPIPAGHVELPPTSITFFAVADAGNRDCQ